MKKSVKVIMFALVGFALFSCKGIIDEAIKGVTTISAEVKSETGGGLSLSKFDGTLADFSDSLGIDKNGTLDFDAPKDEGDKKIMHSSNAPLDLVKIADAPDARAALSNVIKTTDPRYGKWEGFLFVGNGIRPLIVNIYEDGNATLRIILNQSFTTKIDSSVTFNRIEKSITDPNTYKFSNVSSVTGYAKTLSSTKSIFARLTKKTESGKTYLTATIGTKTIKVFEQDASDAKKFNGIAPFTKSTLVFSKTAYESGRATVTVPKDTKLPSSF